MIGAIRKFIAIGVLVAAPLATLLVPGTALAASETWTGGDCPAVNCFWSNPNNWLSNVIPTNGDDVIIDNAAIANQTDSPIDDIAGLSLTSITFINDSSASEVDITLGADITVTSAITQASSVTTTTNFIGYEFTPWAITLGGNVTISSNSTLIIGADTGLNDLDIGSNTLTLNESSAAGSTIWLAANIIGSGNVVYDAAHTEFDVSGNNTYSGTTHVIHTAAQGVVKADGNNFDPFGASAVTIESTGFVNLTQYNANTTISNQFIVNGVGSGTPTKSLNFGDDSTAGVTLTVPNITLNGDTEFDNTSVASPPLVANLAGITANGHCIVYQGYGTDTSDGPSNGFTNGATGCVQSASTGGPTTPGSSSGTPTTPNTGFALVSAHPVVTLTLTTVLAGSIFGIAQVNRKLATRR
jgi:hypothetical protein